MKPSIILMLFAILLTACTPPTPPPPTVDVPATQGAMIATIMAQHTETEAARSTQTSTVTLTPSTTETPGATSTPSATDTPKPTTTSAPSATVEIIYPTATDIPLAGNCNPAYPDLCLTHDVTCTEIGVHNFRVLPPDPYGLDRDNDGIGCEKN